MGMTSISVGGTALSTLSDNVRLLKYGSGAKRGRNHTIPHRDGEYATTQKWFTSTDMVLEVALSAATSREENLSDLLALIHDMTGLVIIIGTTTFHGTIRAQVEMLDEPRPGQNPNIYLIPLHNPKGMWEDNSATTASSASPPVVTTAGDLPVDDMVLTVALAGNHLEHTDSNGVVSRITIDSGAGGTAPYVVDCGARTVFDSAGTPVAKDAFLTVTQPWWMRWEAATAQSFTATGSTAASWRDKWAI